MLYTYTIQLLYAEQVAPTIGPSIFATAIGDNSWGEADTDYSAMTTASGLRRLAQTVDGIGPWIDLVIKDPELVGRAHREGLVVHPYTFRRDDLPSGFDSFAELMRFGIDEAGIDGLFTDFPDLARAEIDL